MSSDVQVLSGGFIIVVGRETSAIDPTADDGRSPLGEASGESAIPLGSVGVALMRLGLVIGMADLVTVREAMALARALWWGEREARTISHLMS